MVLVHYTSAGASTQTVSPQTTSDIYFTLISFIHHHISQFHTYYTLGYTHLFEISFWTYYITHGHGLQQNKTTRRDEWYSRRWIWNFLGGGVNWQTSTFHTSPRYLHSHIIYTVTYRNSEILTKPIRIPYSVENTSVKPNKNTGFTHLQIEQNPRYLCPLSLTEFVEPPPPSCRKNSWVRHCPTVHEDPVDTKGSRISRNVGMLLTTCCHNPRCGIFTLLLFYR
jgi:hypothetical protein